MRFELQKQTASKLKSMIQNIWNGNQQEDSFLTNFIYWTSYEIHLKEIKEVQFVQKFKCNEKLKFKLNYLLILWTYNIIN